MLDTSVVFLLCFIAAIYDCKAFLTFVKLSFFQTVTVTFPWDFFELFQKENSFRLIQKEMFKQ